MKSQTGINMPDSPLPAINRIPGGEILRTSASAPEGIYNSVNVVPPRPEHGFGDGNNAALAGHRCCRRLDNDVPGRDG
jgi:hypothetical protein